MENKEVKITPPEGYEVDEENSTFECIKFKPKKKINVYEDLDLVEGYRLTIGKIIPHVGMPIKDPEIGNIIDWLGGGCEIAYSEADCRKMLAWAKISQLMPYYGGMPKYNSKGYLVFFAPDAFTPAICEAPLGKGGNLIFQTQEDAERFISFPENVQLIKDYYMIEE